MIDHGQDFTCKHGEAHPCPKGCPETAAARTERLLSTVRDGAWLDAQTFAPLRYAVPGLVAEGLTLLIGAPKAGKSWLALAILLAVASGGRALGRIDVPKAPVLYLGMEDGHRRMQDRCRSLLGSRYRPDEPIPPGFSYVTEVPPGQAIALIDAFVGRHPDTALVVVDTLGTIKPPALPNESPYQHDYRVGRALKAIADRRPGLALVVVHHDNKRTPDDDFVLRVSGTNGLAGAADSIIVLSRARDAAEGTLSVTGRDIVEGKYAATLADGTWVLDGADLTEAAKTARQRATVAGVGEDLAAIVEAVTAHPEGIGPTAIAAAVDLDVSKVRVYLRRALEAKRVSQTRRGVYIPVTSVTSQQQSSMGGYTSNTETDRSPARAHLKQDPDEDVLWG